MNANTEPDSLGAGLLRVTVSVAGSDPEIWRLLELDPALTLDRVHEVLQLAFGWHAAHLHAFADADPGGGPGAGAGLLGEPRQWLTQDSLDEDLHGLLETEWTLGQVLTAESGPLLYEYDFGDGWVHRIDLVGVVQRAAGDLPALLVRGERRGPLEDSGGIDGYASLVTVLADPAHEGHRDAAEWVAETVGPWEDFDAEALDVPGVNRELHLLFRVAGDRGGPGAPARSMDALAQRMHPGWRQGFRAYLAAAGADGSAQADAATAERLLGPYLWLLRRVGVDGLPLTAAGWLPPAVVGAAMRDLGWELRWFGAFNREEQTRPIRRLRETAQGLGLVRKSKGRLVLGAAARRLLDDPVGLWSALASALAHRRRSAAEADAVLLLAVEVAAGRRAGQLDYLGPISFALSALGWTSGDGGDVSLGTVAQLIEDAWEVLVNLGVLAFDREREDSTGVTEAGSAFGRAILQA